MLSRIGVVLSNTYREAVRARVLHGLFALALVTAGYCLVVGAFAVQSSLRVVSDLGAASVSLYGVIVAVVLGATSLYRELELKTIFPILARPIRRPEYLVGKYLGTVSTIAVFVAANSGVLLLSLALMTRESPTVPLAVFLGSAVAFVLVGFRFERLRTYLPIPWALLLAALGYVLADGAPDDRRVVLGAALLTVSEVAVVAAIAMVFSSFSSPFLTATFTFGVFIVGRSADSLARLPERVFGHAIHAAAVWISKVVPNLMVYVPPRSLLTGEAVGVPLGEYLLLATGQAVLWSVGLLALASVIFRRRDFL
jgi:ABC-type transport system involved in multi-copper enzyme maturation permease subunit